MIKAFDGCEVMEAVDVLGTACTESSQQGQKIGDKQKMLHAFVPIYYIAKLVNEIHGRKGIVAIKDDGDVSFTIEAGKDKTIGKIVKKEIF